MYFKSSRFSSGISGSFKINLLLSSIVTFFTIWVFLLGIFTLSDWGLLDFGCTISKTSVEGNTRGLIDNWELLDFGWEYLKNLFLKLSSKSFRVIGLIISEKTLSATL